MKVTVHHAVGGAEYTRDMQPTTKRHGSNGGSITRCHSIPLMPYTMFYGLHYDTRDETVWCRWEDLQDISRRWVESKAWNDDAPERIARRYDKRGGYGRSHSVIWPDEKTADRLRHLVPFVDPATIGIGDLRSCPEAVILEDDPCPHCKGTGTAP